MILNIGIVEDHQLVLKSLSLLIATFSNCKVLVEALNGSDLQSKMSTLKTCPDIMLIDVNMTVMDGAHTAAWLSKEYPAIKLVALSVNNTDIAIIKMIRSGCCAYFLKDSHPDKLEKALETVNRIGYCHEDLININYRRLIGIQKNTNDITEREDQFLQLACSELTYKEIADKMFLSERTIDGYRESLFKKFNVQSRVGLVLEALRKGFVQL